MMNDREAGGPANSSTLVAWLELVRLPNVFTAVADVAMGFLFVRAISGPADGWALGLLVLASVALYCAGMVLNDLFDREIDAVERPERPLPSGRIAPATAGWFGAGLLLLGVAAGFATSLLVGHLLPTLVAFMLAGCVLAYDAALKRTVLGPLAMGVCRMFNVMLGMSVLATSDVGFVPWGAAEWIVAGGIGLYVVGVTWFARDEAGQSDRGQLGLATIIMVLGIGLLAWLPDWIEHGRLVALLQAQPWRWQMFMLLLALWIGWRNLKAVFDPSPARVQMIVRQGILSLVVFDAAVTFAVRGRVESLAVLALLIPTILLGQWIHST